MWAWTSAPATQPTPASYETTSCPLCVTGSGARRTRGRVLRNDDLAEFPIDLGAEWIHDRPSILAELLDDADLDGSVDVIPYSPDSLHTRSGERIRPRNWAANYYFEYKFHRTTWYGFLERWIVPSIGDRIRYSTPVTTVNTEGERVVLSTPSGEFEADRVLITVPIKVLQDGMLNFVPALPSATSDAIDRIDVPHGIKVFLRMERRFYPDILLDAGFLSSGATDKLYYDAAYRKDSPDNVLGLFWVSNDAEELVVHDDDEIVRRVLMDLDSIFDGRASRFVTDSVVKNWSADPYIRGAYSIDFDGSRSAIVNTIRTPVDGRVFFSGEALSLSAQATVHGAMLSAYEAVEDLLR